MKSVKENQLGFSAIEILIVIVLVGLVAGIGWYVFRSTNKETGSTALNTVDVNKFKEGSDTVDYAKYEQWETYTSPKGKLSFKHPALSTMSWKEIVDYEVELSNDKDSELYLSIEGQQAKLGQESGPANIMDLYGGSLLQVEQRFDTLQEDLPNLKKEYIKIKGVNAVLYTQTVETNIIYRTYLLERLQNNDTVVMTLSNIHEAYFDEAYQGIFDTLNLNP